jgi:hypothetical protein
MTPKDALLQYFPTLATPFDDEAMSTEDFMLAVSLLESGVFSGEFPDDLLASLFRQDPAAH